MTDEQDKAFNKVLEALCFYANAKIYRGKPIPLELNLDRETLKLAHSSHNAKEIMQDRGELARLALFEFEGVFDCEYDIQSEI